jgi:hypothetical protein
MPQPTGDGASIKVQREMSARWKYVLRHPDFRKQVRELRELRSGPIRLHSSPRFLSGVSTATYAASLPVGSITA